MLLYIVLVVANDLDDSVELSNLFNLALTKNNKNKFRKQAKPLKAIKKT